MTINIESLTFDVIIGLLDYERNKAQTVVIDLEASYDYVDGEFVDYATVVSLVQNELEEKRYELLEEALLGIKSLLFKTYPQVKTLSLKISKPHIIEQCNVALSSTWKS